LVNVAWQRLAREIARRRSVILAYHGVGPATPDDPHHLDVPPERFRAQLDLLRSAGFEFVTVAAMAERARGAAPPPGFAALSFDDGMENNYTAVLPILREFSIPATVYVTTGLIGKTNPWVRGGSRMMDESQLLELAAAGIELGAHTVTHPDLSQADAETCRREVVHSREALERLTGVPVLTFSYPFCRYGPAALNAVREAGFRAAVTCEGRGGWGSYEMKRAIVTGKDGFSSLLLKLVDAYQPLFESLPGRFLRATTRGPRRYVGRRPRA
jgi:peptidoglycan/xylan/chitin deacetylase (PgdA/CDA1 family)